MNWKNVRYEFIEEYDYDSHNFDSKGVMEYVRMRKKELKNQSKLKSEGTVIKTPLFGNTFCMKYRFATHSSMRPNEFEHYYVLAELNDTGHSRCHVHYSLVRDRMVRWKEIFLSIFCMVVGFGVVLIPESIIASKVVFGIIGLLGLFLLISKTNESSTDVRPALMEMRELLELC